VADMLDVADRVPAATIFTAPRESTTIDELAANGPILLVFYLFDWSST
jgi:hypothetical protein